MDDDVVRLHKDLLRQRLAERRVRVRRPLDARAHDDGLSPGAVLLGLTLVLAAVWLVRNFHGTTV